MRSSDRRRRLANFLLALAGTVLPFVVAEAGMRLYHAYAKVRSEYKPAANPRQIFDRKPHSDHDVNALGFRDREHTLQKPAGVSRIVVLGDSVTAGYGVEFEDMYTTKLQSLLDQGQRRYEVINLAMNQYTTVQEVEAFQGVGLSLSPDIVIVAYVLNDPTPTGSINEFFLDDRSTSIVFEWFTRSLRLALGIDEPFIPLPDCEYFDATTQMHCDTEKWMGIETSFFELRVLAQQHDFRVLVVAFPLLGNSQNQSFADYKWRSIHDRVLHEAARNGFSTLDLLPYFATRKPAEVKVQPSDYLHFNAVGNEIAAVAIRQKLALME